MGNDGQSHEVAVRYWRAAGEGRIDATTVSPGQRSVILERVQRRLLQGWGLRQVRRARPGGVRRLIDLGCGFGDGTAVLARLAQEVVALDVSPGLVRAAQERLRWHPRAHVVCADLLEFDAFAAPDLVSLGGVLMYLADAQATAMLARARRHMPPGALLLHREFVAAHDGDEWSARGPSASYRRTASRYRQWAREAGFALVTHRHSPGIFAEQALFETLGLRREWPTRLLAAVPRLVARALMGARRACSWTALYRAA